MKKFKSILPKSIVKNTNTNCKISGKHVHLYTKIIDGEEVRRYILGEKLEVDGYKQTDKYMKRDKFYDEILKLINKHHLLRAEDNIDYLYYFVSKDRPFYLEYEYKYIGEGIRFITDEEGYSIPVLESYEQTGWHGKINDKHNTGRVRQCTPMYYGYKIVMENNKPKLVKSPLVGDLNDIINEYPFYKENFKEIVTEELPPYTKKI